MKQGRQTIAAGEFKARCLGILDQVARTKDVVIVTKRGRSIAKVVPMEDSPPKTLRGSITYHGDIVQPVDAAWEAAS